MDEFFDLILRFITINGFEGVEEYFNNFSKDFSVVYLEPKFEYVRSTAFITEALLKPEEYKKRNNQFTKPKSSAKWLNYAWDILR